MMKLLTEKFISKFSIVTRKRLLKQAVNKIQVLYLYNMQAIELPLHFHLVASSQINANAECLARIFPVHEIQFPFPFSIPIPIPDNILTVSCNHNSNSNKQQQHND